MSLKIIAIKTGENNNSYCKFLEKEQYYNNVDYLKILKPNTVYSFNSNYSFPNKDFSEINYNYQSDIDLYSLELSDKRKIPLNISAVVGENGCGKSTLIELLYWMNYNIGCKLELLHNDDEDDQYLPCIGLNLELLYKSNDDYCILKFFESQDRQQATISVLKFKLNDGKYIKLKNTKWKEFTYNELSDFFYSIVINYSFYALNAREIGIWINPLFYKNDGYQTPIVLNPKRTDGCIDVNQERTLLSRRLQSNILEPIGEDRKIEDSLRNLANGKIAKTLRIEYDEIYSEHNKISSADIEKCNDIEPIIIQCLKSIFGVDKINDDFYDYVIKYICKKLLKMVKRYPSIYDGIKDDNSNINELLKKIKDTPSHTAFKIKGAILHLKYYHKIYHGSCAKAMIKRFNPIVDPFSIDIVGYSKLIEDIKQKEDFYINTYMMAFPSFFKVTIQPEKKEENSKCPDDMPIDTFSSGEKQRINGLSSIVYHILNLNSVKGNDNVIHYKYINIILDEIELYYHPEWQRTFISDLVNYLNKINPANISNIEGINIILVTHSPFILSDIPNSHIIRLDRGMVKEYTTKEQTFGANVHDLLANSFFMPNGFMGKFAEQKINSVITYLEQCSQDENFIDKIWTKETVKKFIEQIGEPLIKYELKEMYFKTFKDELQKEIDRLTALQTIKK
jgi:predicted ATP-binding protein involved in virulence